MQIIARQWMLLLSVQTERHGGGAQNMGPGNFPAGACTLEEFKCRTPISVGESDLELGVGEGSLNANTRHVTLSPTHRLQRQQKTF